MSLHSQLLKIFLKVCAACRMTGITITGRISLKRHSRSMTSPHWILFGWPTSMLAASFHEMSRSLYSSVFYKQFTRLFQKSWGSSSCEEAMPKKRISTIALIKCQSSSKSWSDKMKARSKTFEDSPTIQSSSSLRACSFFPSSRCVQPSKRITMTLLMCSITRVRLWRRLTVNTSSLNWLPHRARATRHWWRRLRIRQLVLWV